MGGAARTAETPMAGRHRLDLWAGQEAVSTPEGGASHAGDALWTAHGAANRVAEAGLKRSAEQRVYRAPQLEGAPKRRRTGPLQLVNAVAGAAVAGPSGEVASVLAVCPAAPVVTGDTRTAAGPRWQTPAPAVPASDTSDGRRIDKPALERRRSPGDRAAAGAVRRDLSKGRSGQRA